MLVTFNNKKFMPIYLTTLLFKFSSFDDDDDDDDDDDGDEKFLWYSRTMKDV